MTTKAFTLTEYGEFLRKLAELRRTPTMRVTIRYDFDGPVFYVEALTEMFSV